MARALAFLALLVTAGCGTLPVDDTFPDAGTEHGDLAVDAGPCQCPPDCSDPHHLPACSWCSLQTCSNDM